MQDNYKKLNNLINNMEVSIKDDMNLENNLSNYINQVLNTLNEIEDYEKYNEIITSRLEGLIYKLIKYSVIYYNNDTQKLINKVKNNNTINKNISLLIEKDISTISNSTYMKPDILDAQKLEKLIEEKATNYELVDEEIIRFICNINIDLRGHLIDDLTSYSNTLDEKNNLIISKIQEYEKKEQERNTHLAINKNLLDNIKKQTLSIVLSLSLTVGTFAFANLITRDLMNNSKKQNHTEEEYSMLLQDEEFIRRKNIISTLFGMITATAFANLPKSGLKDTYKKYKDLEKKLKENDYNLKGLIFIIDDLRSEIEYETYIDEENLNKINELFNELYGIVGYYYANIEERKTCEDVKNIARQSLVLRNRAMDL